MNHSRSILLAGLVLAAILVLGGIAVGVWVQNTVAAEDILLPLVGTGDGDSVVVARASVRRLNAGDTLTVSCAGQELTPNQVDALTVFLSCNAGVTPPPPPTATAVVPPTATPPAGATPTPMAHDAADLAWHAPGAHGDRPAHEHGDAPPSWVTAAGYNVEFTHVGGTPNENHFYWKHTGFKGWAGRLKGVDFYGIFHLDVNPSGHVSRFHSYQLWLRDSTGAVSHMSGWMDFGEDNNTGPNLVVTCAANSNVRPLILVNEPGCSSLTFEAWYMQTHAEWAPGFGFSINPNYYTGGDPNDPATWQSTGRARNVERRIELTWVARTNTPRGEFWTTQFGNVIDGPTDPVCDGLHELEVGDKTYTLVCLNQYIAPSLTSIGFPDNAVQITAAGNGIVLPN